MRPFQQLLQQARQDRPRWPPAGSLEREVWDGIVSELRELHQQEMLDRIYGNDILMEET